MPDRPAAIDADFDRLSEPELRALDASLGMDEAARWDGFFANRSKPCPFFVSSPDESLAEWVEDGVVPPGRAVDLGCGNGRNAIFLARQGFRVEGIDSSARALEWAGERAAEAGVSVALTQANVLEWSTGPGAFDLVYDSGCFHHIAPHRRAGYVARVTRLLRPGGFFGLTCFRPEGADGCTDDDVYRHRSMKGGIGFDESQLRAIWSGGLNVSVLRQMRRTSPGSGLFGEDFLWVLLAQKSFGVPLPDDTSVARSPPVSIQPP